MFSIFKKKTVELHFYTNNKMVYDCFPIRPATEFPPPWWRDLPKYPKIPDWNQPSTMKGCNGLLDLQKNSFVIPLWCELMLKKEHTDDRSDVKLIFSNDSFRTEQHPVFQFNGLLDHDQWAVHKLMNPWLIESNTNVDLLVHDCLYHRQEFFGQTLIFSGVLDPYIDPEINPFLALRNDTENTLIPAGIPLIYITPLTDRRVKVFCHHDPWKHATTHSGFFSFYNKGFKKRRQMEISKDKKCPFSIT